ncbi:hypothetical protein Tco_0349849 [Tanacetum coccineum]
MQPVAKGLPSITPKDGIHQSNSLPEGKPTHPQDIKGNLHLVVTRLPATHPDEGISTSQPLSEGTPIDTKDSGSNIQLTDRGLPSTLVIVQSGADTNYQDLSDEEIYEAGEEIDDEQPYTKEEPQPTQHHSPEPSKEKSPFLHISPEPSLEASKKPKKSKKKRHSEDNWVKHEEVAASYADLRAVVEEYVEENDDHRTQTKKAMNNTMELIEKINKSRFNECTNLLKSLNKVSETLKDDSTLKAPCRPWKKPTPLHLATSPVSLRKNSNFPEFMTQLNAFQTSINSLSSYLRDFNLQSIQTRITNLENTQVIMQSDITSIKTDTSAMKEMMTEMFNAFKGFSSSTPSGIPTLQQPESQSYITPKDNKGKDIARDTDDSPCKLVKATREVCLDPNALLLINYEINRVMYQLTNEEIQAYLEKHEQMEKVAKEARLIELSKPTLIKVVEEVANEAGVDPKVL